MIILQIWGGAFYLTNKVLFSLSEARKDESGRHLKLWGWGIYILGVPAWVIILLGEKNWIAASIEAGGLPSMLLGFYMVYKNRRIPDKIADRITSFFTYGAITLGVAYSLSINGGIATSLQILEIGATIGFLCGSYLLAKNKNTGWLFFMLMNGCMGSLMMIQNKPLLAFQQLVSLSFVLYGLFSSMNDKAGETPVPS